MSESKLTIWGWATVQPVDFDLISGTQLVSLAKTNELLMHTTFMYCDCRLAIVNCKYIRMIVHDTKVVVSCVQACHFIIVCLLKIFVCNVCLFVLLFEEY